MPDFEADQADSDDEDGIYANMCRALLACVHAIRQNSVTFTWTHRSYGRTGGSVPASDVLMQLG